MAKVLCVLYDDPVDGYPTAYARDGVPEIDQYHAGSSNPTPPAIDSHVLATGPNAASAGAA